MCTIRSLTPLFALSLLAAPVHASGVDLRWDRCFGDGGVQNKNFACDTNDGTETLVGSFVPASDIADVIAIKIDVHILVDAMYVPPWWYFGGPGYCRELSMSFDVVDPPSAVNCPDWAAGSGSGASAYAVGTGIVGVDPWGGPNGALLVATVTVPPAAPQMLTSREYFAFNVTIDNAKTVGEGSCAGCTTPACILFVGLTMVTPVPANDRTLTGPSNLTDSDYATWQGGGHPVSGGRVGCPNATPTRQRTWGAVKALYR